LPVLLGLMFVRSLDLFILHGINKKMLMGLEDFLEQHSAIPNAFIDSFLAMYNPDTVQTDLVIDMLTKR
jgi:hypothetical protein